MLSLLGLELGAIMLRHHPTLAYRSDWGLRPFNLFDFYPWCSSVVMALAASAALSCGDFIFSFIAGVLKFDQPLRHRNPFISASLREFWGQRWNLMFGPMFRRLWFHSVELEYRTAVRAQQQQMMLVAQAESDDAGHAIQTSNGAAPNGSDRTQGDVNGAGVTLHQRHVTSSSSSSPQESSNQSQSHHHHHHSAALPHTVIATPRIRALRRKLVLATLITFALSGLLHAVPTLLSLFPQTELAIANFLFFIWAGVSLIAETALNTRAYGTVYCVCVCVCCLLYTSPSPRD